MGMANDEKTKIPKSSACAGGAVSDPRRSSCYDAMRESLPDTMYVDENSESPFQPLTKHPLLTISEDTKEAEKTEFGETGGTVVECSAAGIPLKRSV